MTLHYDRDLGEDVLGLIVRIGESLRSGLVRGTIRLHSSLGDEHSIDIIGLIGPKK